MYIKYPKILEIEMEKLLKSLQNLKFKTLDQIKILNSSINTSLKQHPSRETSNTTHANRPNKPLLNEDPDLSLSSL